MKLKDKQALRANDLKNLENLLNKTRDELSNLRLDKTQNKLKNTRSIFLKRKQIALILTLITEKEISEKVKNK